MYVSCFLRGTYSFQRGPDKTEKMAFQNVSYDISIDVKFDSHFKNVLWIFILNNFISYSVSAGGYFRCKKSAKNANTLVHGRGTHTSLFLQYTLFFYKNNSKIQWASKSSKSKNWLRKKNPTLEINVIEGKIDFHRVLFILS